MSGEDKRCNRQPLGGGLCELSKGHEGKHQMTLRSYDYASGDQIGTPSGVFEWTDESQTLLADKYGSRFD